MSDSQFSWTIHIVPVLSYLSSLQNSMSCFQKFVLPPSPTFRIGSLMCRQTCSYYDQPWKSLSTFKCGPRIRVASFSESYCSAASFGRLQLQMASVLPLFCIDSWNFARIWISCYAQDKNVFIQSLRESLGGDKLKLYKLNSKERRKTQRNVHWQNRFSVTNLTGRAAELRVSILLCHTFLCAMGARKKVFLVSIRQPFCL